MAIVFTAWRADGRGQSEIKHLRTDAQGYSHEGRDLWLKTMQDMRECVLITKGRTDRQSHWESVLWTRPGYTDPTAL